MMRWLCWFVLAPQLFLLLGWLGEQGLGPIDAGVLLCLFLALFAEPRALPGLLLGAAVGRALVDEAPVPVQLLVLGVPVAVLLPLRVLFYRQHWWWQVAVAALFSLAIPKLAGLCGQLFDHPSASARLDGVRVVGTAVLAPVLLALLRRLPPLLSFVERSA